MTGVEPIAIAGKVVGAAAKAERGDAEDREVLRELAKESGALDPAALAYAKRLAVKEQIRMKIWQPLGMLFGISRDYFENEFADDMAERVAQIPEEELITPRLSLAGPTVQGIAFTVDEPELRTMYLNLLAAASDARRADTAHPSFPEIIRQLTPEEAVLLNPLLAEVEHPIVELRLNVATTPHALDHGYDVLAPHILNWEPEAEQRFFPERAMMVVNWVRLGLVALSYDKALIDAGVYDWVQDNAQVVSVREQFDTEEFRRVEIQRGVLEVTPFGRAFHRVVMQEPAGGLELLPEDRPAPQAEVSPAAEQSPSGSAPH